MDLSTDLGASFAKGLDETLSIAIVGKCRFAAVIAGQNMMDGAGILDAHLASTDKFR